MENTLAPPLYFTGFKKKIKYTIFRGIFFYMKVKILEIYLLYSELLNFSVELQIIRISDFRAGISCVGYPISH